VCAFTMAGEYVALARRFPPAAGVVKNHLFKLLSTNPGGPPAPPYCCPYPCPYWTLPLLTPTPAVRPPRPAPRRPPTPRRPAPPRRPPPRTNGRAGGVTRGGAAGAAGFNEHGDLRERLAVASGLEEMAAVVAELTQVPPLPAPPRPRPRPRPRPSPLDPPPPPRRRRHRQRRGWGRSACERGRSGAAGSRRSRAPRGRISCQSAARAPSLPHRRAQPRDCAP